MSTGSSDNVMAGGDTDESTMPLVAFLIIVANCAKTIKI